MSRRPLPLYAAVVVSLLTGCSAVGSSRPPEGIDGPVSSTGAGAAVLGGTAAPNAAQAAAAARLVAANTRLLASLDDLRMAVPLLPQRDALEADVAEVDLSLRRLDAGASTARTAAAAGRCGDVTAQVTAVRGAADAAQAELASLQRSLAGSGTLGSRALADSGSARASLEALYDAVVADLFATYPHYDARTVLGQVSADEQAVGNGQRGGEQTVSSAAARAQRARALTAVVTGLGNACRASLVSAGGRSPSASVPPAVVFTPPGAPVPPEVGAPAFPPRRGLTRREEFPAPRKARTAAPAAKPPKSKASPKAPPKDTRNQPKPKPPPRRPSTSAPPTASPRPGSTSPRPAPKPHGFVPGRQPAPKPAPGSRPPATRSPAVRPPSPPPPPPPTGQRPPNYQRPRTLPVPRPPKVQPRPWVKPNPPARPGPRRPPGTQPPSSRPPTSRPPSSPAPIPGPPSLPA
ncbi:MAG TPA: hypothetical protein VKP64_00465, partial [Mycobacteriales bacterium]|nr:hypothetical protein [Mycobacteriales bacterium]